MRRVLLYIVVYGFGVLLFSDFLFFRDFEFFWIFCIGLINKGRVRVWRIVEGFYRWGLCLFYLNFISFRIYKIRVC